jgi:uncharacterized protein (TIGR03086 family)
MQTSQDLRPQHRRALAAAGEAVLQVGPDDLSRPTTCAGWDLGTLLAHMIGQNGGFAVAVSTSDADECDYAAPAIRPDELREAWTRSADRVLTAFDSAELDREVRLVEINPDVTFPAAVVVGMHLLDTVIHTWDVATSLGDPYRPDDELVDIVAAQAERVPAGTTRTRPGAAFAPVVATTKTDPWLKALAMLGRSSPG